ncbi:NmrA/HSCARG family protein [bacterium]|nr:NmrA/HSCARG family protein [bacterium]
MDKIILVTGATGRQGGACARHLLEKGWKVRVMTRTPGSDSAKALEEKGAYIVQGDFDNTKALEAAVSGTYGVFGVQNFWEVGVEREVQQGKAIADAAKKANVSHFIYTSVVAANRGTGLPHFESKYEIERHIRNLELPATFLRPVAFMENYYVPQVYKNLLKGKLVDPVRSDVILQLIAVDDIGAFATLAFDNPNDFIGATIEIAGDQLSNLEIATIFGKVMGIPVRYKKMPMPMVRLFMGKELHQMFKWFNAEGFAADIEDLHTRYSQIAWTTLEQWLLKEGWDKKIQAAQTR